MLARALFASTGGSRFNRRVGEYSERRFNVQGNPIAEHEFTVKSVDWLPSQSDLDFIESLMHAVVEQGKIAAWIAPPKRGINHQPFEFEYVKHPDH